MSRIDFVNSNISGFKKNSTEANNLEEIKKLIEDEGWSAEVFFDFEIDKWVVYCFHYTNRMRLRREEEGEKPYKFKKYMFRESLISPYLVTSDLRDKWDSLQHIGKGWVNTLDDYISGRVKLIKRH